MGKKRLIGSVGMLAVASLGLLTYGLIFGPTPDLRHALGEAVRPHQTAGFGAPATATSTSGEASPREASSEPETAPVRQAPAHVSALAMMPVRSPSEGRFFSFGSGLPASDEKRIGGLSVPGEVDYRDPVEDGAVPLVRVWDRMDEPVSAHFRVRDFAARDGAAFARISPDLVEVLEKLYEHLDTPVHITSAYRHPALNAKAEIDGATESRHMAGLAADIWAEAKAPLEIVEAALEVHGCQMGVGLGSHFIHIDLREYTGSWAYEGAAMAEADFDLWMLDRCADSFGEQARLLAGRSLCLEPQTGIRVAEVHRKEMTTFADVHRRRGVAGAVILDLSAGPEENRDRTSSRMGFLPVDSPLVRLMGLEPVIRRAEGNQNFVFVLVERDGAYRTGLMRYDGERSTPVDAEAEEVPACE